MSDTQKTRSFGLARTRVRSVVAAAILATATSCQTVPCQECARAQDNVKVENHTAASLTDRAATPTESAPTEPRPGDRLPRRGDEISIAGQLFHTGTRVVLWNDVGGYDAYRAHCHFRPEDRGPSSKPEAAARFDSLRRGLAAPLETRVRAQGWTLEDLQQAVTQVVVHYDVAGTSDNCFRVLHDIRGLSVHFLLDLDGTLYQTLDVKERAWHAAVANDRSVGIEIASLGAYRSEAELQRRYRTVGGEVVIEASGGQEAGGLPAGFASRPARPGVWRGAVHGIDYYQYDFTEAQYQTLEKLLVTLLRVLPEIEPRVPRDASGNLVWSTLDNEAREFRGVLGHYHITTDKQDPGPAFDWERIERVLLAEAQ
ncbi:MAG: N-acetylmuramoyl-L-alanine amidase [Planctomycetota bacterium]